MKHHQVEMVDLVVVQTEVTVQLVVKPFNQVNLEIQERLVLVIQEELTLQVLELD